MYVVEQLSKVAGPGARSYLTDEERLSSILFRHYDPSLRPVYNSSEAVEIVFGLNLIGIANMDEVTKLNGIYVLLI